MRLQRFFSLIILLLITIVAWAQPAPPFSNDNIFYLDNGLIKQIDPETLENIDWDAPYPYNEDPVLSPDGTKFAYNSWASDAGNRRVEATGGVYMGAMLSNIWVMDLSSNAAVRIAGQPTGATLYGDNPVGIARSRPAWSPDGQFVAYTQLVFPGFTYQLAKTNVSTGVTTVLVEDLPTGFQDGAFYLHPPKWGEIGIVIFRIDIIGQGEVDQVLTVHNPDTGAVSVSVATPESDFPIYDFVIIEDDSSILGVATGDGWRTLDRYAGLISTYTVGIELVARYSEESVALRPSVALNSGSRWSWSARDAEGNLLDSFSTDNLHEVGVSLDGSRYAYIDGDFLHIRVGSQTQQVTPAVDLIGKSGMAWGASYWRLASACVQATRLVVGQTAYILPGMGANRLRAEPGSASSNPVIGDIPENGTINLLEGPVCADQRQWWLVDYEGQVGWTAEGDGDTTYWIQGVNG